MKLDCQLFDVARPVCYPTVIALECIAVALGEGEETAAKGMPHQLQQGKEVAGAVGEWGAGQQMDHGAVTGISSQVDGEAVAFRAMVLQ